jgi:hypothetical protein
MTTRWREELERWKRRLPPAMWDAMLRLGKNKPCTCDNRPDLLCWKCISISDDADFLQSCGIEHDPVSSKLDRHSKIPT